MLKLNAIVIRNLFMAVCLAVALASFAGCSSSGSKKGMEAATALEGSAARIEKARGQVKNTLASMNDLVNSPKPDPRGQYKTFTKNVDELEKLAKNAGDTSDEMQDRGDEYFQKWEKDLEKIKNEDMREAGSTRRAERLAQFNHIKAAYQDVKASSVPFMNDLRNIRTSLNADMSRSGIESMKSFAAKANDHYGPLDKALENLSSEFRTFGVEVSPVSKH